MDYLIWDWNGTLFDDLDLSLYCLNRLLYNNGYKPIYTYEEYKSVFRFPIKDYYVKAGFDFSKKPYEILADEYMEMYLPMAKYCSLNKDALKTLDAVDKKGIRQVILTATTSENLIKQLEPFGIEDLFYLLLGTDNHYSHSKMQLAKEFRERAADAGNIYYIGDSMHDYEVAKAMGAKTFLHKEGHQKLYENDGYILIDKIYDIVKYL